MRPRVVAKCDRRDPMRGNGRLLTRKLGQSPIYSGPTVTNSRQTASNRSAERLRRSSA